MGNITPMFDCRVNLSIAGLLLAAWLLPTGAAAQIAIGDRVRIRAAEPAPGRFTGTVLQPTHDWITLRTDTGQVVIPLRAINRIDLSIGRSARRPTLTGLAIGGVAGLAAGILWVIGYECVELDCLLEPGLALVFPMGSMFAGMAVGALVGHAVGRQWPAENWQRVAPTPAAGGLRVAVSLPVDWFR